jgi:transketolase
MSNLNLVNVIKQPKPIVIENVRQYHRIIPSTPQESSEFRYIDEEKLAMYSFIAKRNLQEKEWKNRFEQLDEKPVKLAKDSDIKTQERKSAKTNEKNCATNKKKLLNIPTKSQLSNEVAIIKQVEPQVTKSAVDAKINEIKEIINEMNNCFDELEFCLDKCKFI